MHLSLALRFRGYWLGLLGWLMLSFASPLSSALAQGDKGWMQLCSTYGVHWVQLSDQDDSSANQSNCQCLLQALTADSPKPKSVEPIFFFSAASDYSAPRMITHYVIPFSRAPPLTYGG
ncbi:MAG: hypothetical protein P8X74_01200 [Reinekea sp.]